VTSPARTLVAVAVVAVAVALAFAIGGELLYRATLRDTQTHLYPASRAVSAWATRWPPDDASLLARSALSSTGVAAAPELAGETLLAIGAGRLHALDPLTGVQRWDVGYTDGRRVIGFQATPTLAVLVVMRPDPATGLAATSLAGVDVATRAVAWERPLDADAYAGSLLLSADAAYVAVADSVDGGEYQALRERGVAVPLHPRVRAYTLADGALRWERTLPERADAAPVERVALTLAAPVVAASTATAFAPIGMSVFDAASGRALWQAPDGTSAVGVSRARLVTRTGTDLALFAPATGRVVARLRALGARSGPAVVARDVLYQVAGDRVAAVDLVAGRGLWTTALDSPHGGLGAVEGRSRPPAMGADGRLYLGGRDEDVYAIDPRTGAVQWKFPADVTAGGLAAAPLRYGGLVLVQDDQLTAYRAPS
jgi:outer membrane protein assembly factor BamB